MLVTVKLPIPVMTSSRPTKPATPLSRLLWRGSAILFAPLLAGLAGCGGGDLNAFPPACPRAAILGDAADLTRYRPEHAGQGGQDLTDMVFDGRITGVSGKCVRA